MKETYRMYLMKLLKPTVLSATERGDLLDELYDHLVMIEEELQQQGYSGKELEKRTLEEFGEPEWIGKGIQKEMGSRHSFWKKISIYLLVLYGIFLSITVYENIEVHHTNLASIKEVDRYDAAFFIPFQFEGIDELKRAYGYSHPPNLIQSQGWLQDFLNYYSSYALSLVPLGLLLAVIMHHKKIAAYLTIIGVGTSLIFIRFFFTYRFDIDALWIQIVAGCLAFAIGHWLYQKWLHIEVPKTKYRSISLGLLVVYLISLFIISYQPYLFMLNEDLRAKIADLLPSLFESFDQTYYMLGLSDGILLFIPVGALLACMIRTKKSGYVILVIIVILWNVIGALIFGGLNVYVMLQELLPACFAYYIVSRHLEGNLLPQHTKNKPI